MAQFQSRTRLQIRQSIGRNIGNVIVSEATSTVDTTSLIDTLELSEYADDDLIGRQVMIYDAAGSIVDGEVSKVTDNAGSTGDATCNAFTASIADGDKYEMWDVFKIADVNDAIDQAIEKVSKGAQQKKQTTSAFTQSGIYEYNCLSGFNGVHTVEYVSSVGTEVEIDDCDSAWTAGTNATVTADTTYKQEGSACNKIVIASGASTSEVIAYNTFSALDLSGCDELEISILSTVALTAGYLQLRLDDTAGGGSAVESLAIPATSANTQTRHKITLANPLSDTAIVRAEIYQVTDVGACTIYIDYIKAVKSTSRIHKELNPEQWFIVKGSTPYLGLTPSGLSVTGNPTLLRLTGYQNPSMLSADSSTSEVNPDWVIAYCTGMLLMSHPKSSQLKIPNRLQMAQWWLAEASKKEPSTRTQIASNTKWVD